jgi:HSP20 family protein
MAVRDLIPWSRNRSSVPGPVTGDEVNPFLTLHREMNRLFDDVFSRFEAGVPSMLGRAGWPGGSWSGGSWPSGSWPSVEVNASDKEVRVAAELPGLDEKDVEVLVEDNVLTIRGEKRAETEDKDRRFSERYYGRFERSIALPFAIEEDKAEASFKNGVLTVTLPKSAKAEETAKRIAINAGHDTKH